MRGRRAAAILGRFSLFVVNNQARFSFAVGLFSSGVAGLINQVGWQRAAKIYLGGSEALSSMVVVLVFMLGLGLGAAIYSLIQPRIRNPLRFLAGLELSLACVNALVALLLSLGLSDSVFAAQQAAVALGLPLRLIYCTAALALLVPPCSLMGATMPGAAEVCQRCFGWTESRHLGLLFFINTGGAVLGALTCGMLLLPVLGQVHTLLLAASLNLLAAILFVTIPQGATQAAPADGVAEGAPSRSGWTVSPLELAGFSLGLLSLAYEMYLFRIAPLMWQPWPATFSRALSGFLLYWSLGVLASARLKERVLPSLLVTAAMLAVIPAVFSQGVDWDGQQLKLGQVAFLPCLLFGLMYGNLVTCCAVRWGHDVGRFHAMNTLGSGAGILLGTLVGYEMAPSLLAWSIAAGLLLLAVALWLRPGGLECSGREPAAAILGLLGIGFLCFDFYAHPSSNRQYYGRDGVIIVAEGNLYWDGLWHSSLHSNDDYIGTRNWMLGAVPAALHRADSSLDALVVGLGTGVTAVTLARAPGIRQVDVYDINYRLADVLADFPQETLHAATDPKINMIWQDGRSGLSLNPKQYDIITQQPTYLSQAGSSILLSREYLLTLKSRLKPGGVVVIYCNDHGNPLQSQLVRQTVRSVFPCCLTYSKGYGIIASEQPLDLSLEAYALHEAGSDDFAKELRLFYARQQVSILDCIDNPSLPWEGLGQLMVTDDRPLVEYPELLPFLGGVDSVGGAW